MVVVTQEVSAGADDLKKREGVAAGWEEKTFWHNEDCSVEEKGGMECVEKEVMKVRKSVCMAHT